MVAIPTGDSFLAFRGIDGIEEAQAMPDTDDAKKVVQEAPRPFNATEVSVDSRDVIQRKYDLYSRTGSKTGYIARP